MCLGDYDFSVIPSPNWTFGFGTSLGLGLGLGGLDLGLGLDNKVVNYLLSNININSHLKIMSCLNRQIVIIVASNMRRAQKYVERMKTATGYDTGPIVKK